MHSRLLFETSAPRALYSIPRPVGVTLGATGRCGSLGMVRVVFLALLAGFVAPANGSVSCDTYDEDDCAADSECVWIEDWNDCHQTCDGRDEDDCYDPCEWSGDSCSMSCEYRYGDEDECSADSECVWAENWYSCRSTCDDLPDHDCDDHCAWSGASCSLSCEVQYSDDEDDCVADSDCVWIEVWDLCLDTCDGRDEDDCYDHCAWSGDSCSLNCENKYGDDEDDCAADSECVWIEDWNNCQETCDGRDEDDCEDHCEWSGDSCSMGCYFKYADDEDDCSADSGCVWIEDWNDCHQTCDDRDEDECGYPCEWSGDSCLLSCDLKYDDDDECLADSECVWVDRHGRRRAPCCPPPRPAPRPWEAAAAC